jgi:GDP-D-mannose dehydratase
VLKSMRIILLINYRKAYGMFVCSGILF